MNGEDDHDHEFTSSSEAKLVQQQRREHFNADPWCAKDGICTSENIHVYEDGDSYCRECGSWRPWRAKECFPLIPFYLWQAKSDNSINSNYRYSKLAAKESLARFASTPLGSTGPMGVPVLKRTVTSINFSN